MKKVYFALAILLLGVSLAWGPQPPGPPPGVGRPPFDADTLDGIDSTGFSSTDHNHDADYAASFHNHDADYAASFHTHVEYQQKYSNLAVVAQSGGDYTDPVEAMDNVSSGDNWCGIPSETNPCLLKIMPGVYNIDDYSLQMQEYVDIEGSGENVTTITSNNYIDGGAVLGASNAEIRSISVHNEHTIGVAIYSDNASPMITNVTVSSGVNGYGFANRNSARPIIRNSTTKQSRYGAFNYQSSPEFSNVSIDANGYGIYNYSSDCILNGVSITSDLDGVYNGGVTETTGSIKMNYVVVDADRYGVFCGSYGSAEMNHSSIKGDSSSVRGDADTCSFSIGNTKLEGGIVTFYDAIYNCVGVYDESYSPFICAPT